MSVKFEEAATSSSLYRLVSVRKYLHQWAWVEILGASQRFSVDVHALLFFFPPDEEVSGLWTFSHSHQDILDAISHPPLFFKVLHWNAGRLGASSTSLSTSWRKSLNIVHFLSVPQNCSSCWEPLAPFPSESTLDCWVASCSSISLPSSWRVSGLCTFCQAHTSQKAAESACPLSLFLVALLSFC